MEDKGFLDLINKARDGSNIAIQQIISIIVNQPTDSSTATVLSSYAGRIAQSMKLWGEDEIINHMRLVIWQAIVGQKANPNSKCIPRYWIGTKKESFIKCCWTWLVQDVRNQFAKENALKRKGIHIEIGELIGTLPKQMVICPETKELLLLIKYNQEKLTQEQRFIIKRVLEGYSLNEISKQLQTHFKENNQKWYYSKTKNELVKLQNLFYEFVN